jgi:hypothetical protein
MTRSVGRAFALLLILVAAAGENDAGKGAPILSAAERSDLRDSPNSGELDGDLPTFVDQKRLREMQDEGKREGLASKSSNGCRPNALGPSSDPSAPMPFLDVAARVKGRDFPSVFQAWSPVQRINPSPFGPSSALPEDDAGIARHDLSFLFPHTLGLRPNNSCSGLATGFTPESVETGLSHRKRILAANPNAILLLSIFYFEAPPSYLPESSSWWLRDPGSGERKLDPYGYNLYLLDYSNPELQDRIATLCREAVRSGVFDGCMFDNWTQDDKGRVELVARVRRSIGEDALILVNVNSRKPFLTAPYINGMYMEGFNTDNFWKSDQQGWMLAQENLEWAKKNLRSPAFAALEVFYAHSRSDPRDLQMMRASSALALMQSAYILFGDPDDAKKVPPVNHLHDWYPFWDKGLGRPRGEAVTAQGPDGGYIYREFNGGTVVFNPPWNQTAKIDFVDSERTSRATRITARRHDVPAGDGDIFIK